MKDLEALQRDYARLLIREGLNVQAGQRLVINCPVDCAPFARLCADEAYAAGCREVLMKWRDDYLTRARYLHADDSVFDEVHQWEVLMADTVSEEGAAWLAIHADDPENLRDVDPDRIRRAQIVSGRAMEKFREREMRSEFPWCVASIPTRSWAKAVFPGMAAEEAVERLWREILAACRVDGTDAVAAWRAHNEELRRHVRMLNEYDFRTLHYLNSIGTDLTVELPEGHFWAGGSETSAAGIEFSANIPTEEVFTLPKRDGVNGTVDASRPLCHNGNIIDGFRFTLKNGRITEIQADEGEEILRDACTVDEGASYLGEVALVPCDSPISRSGILFYNTLFDENASCHFAFGEAYPCIRGGSAMSEDELKAAGANFSITRVDFMIGTPDLSITGVTRDGREVPVFVNGDFEF